MSSAATFTADLNYASKQLVLSDPERKTEDEEEVSVYRGMLSFFEYEAGPSLRRAYAEAPLSPSSGKDGAITIYGYHGTSETNLVSIRRDGLRRSTTGMMGPCTYLGHDVWKAARFAAWDTYDYSRRPDPVVILFRARPRKIVYPTVGRYGYEGIFPGEDHVCGCGQASCKRETRGFVDHTADWVGVHGRDAALQLPPSRVNRDRWLLRTGEWVLGPDVPVEFLVARRVDTASLPRDYDPVSLRKQLRTLTF